MHIKKLLLATAIMISVTSNAQKSLIKNLDAINPDAIKGSMSFLADDLLEGRLPGTRGFAVASKYVETQFMSLGLVPAFGGSYTQKVPLRKGVVNENESSLVLISNGKEETLTYGKHFLVSPYFFKNGFSCRGSANICGLWHSCPGI